MADTKTPSVIKGLLLVRDMKQSELARLMGVTPQTLNNWYTRGFTDDNARRCLKVLNADAGAYARCGVTP